MTARGGEVSARRRRRATRPKNAREIALFVLFHVQTRRAFADLLLNKALRENDLAPRDAALATELVNGTLRLRNRLDWVLAQYVRSGLDELNPWILNLLRMGLYQIQYLDRIPPHAVVDESVKLARKHGHSGTAALTNAVLRKILHDGDAVPDPHDITTDPDADPESEPEDAGPAYRLSVTGSHPRWLVERWLRRFGDDETQALLQADNEAPALGLRVNSARTDRETLRRALAAHGVEAKPGPYSKHALVVEGNLVPTGVPEFAQGHFFVQDESETLVTELLAPAEGETVLDLCAAPGGKATHIQELRGSRGAVVAVDAQGNRLARVAENVRRLGLERVYPVRADGESLALARPVDRVLVDAPCSGLGVLRRRADARWRKTEASLRALLPLQAGLLEAGAGHVRPGGVLVYSVCSFEPEEGRRHIDRFLAAHPEFALEPAGDFLPSEVVTEGCLLLYPHRHGTDGAFAARLRRRD